MADVSRIAVSEYLPEIKKIYASLEVQLANYGTMNERPMLRMMYLEKEIPASRFMHATHLLNIWLKEKPFKLNPYIFEKTDASAKWTDMMEIVLEKITEYDNGQAAIILSLSKSGRLSREVSGLKLSHDFEGDGFRVEILSLLPQDGSYMPTKIIMQLLGSKSMASVSKLVEAINKVAANKLKLPAKKTLIDSKRRSGYRINPLYNLILEK